MLFVVWVYRQVFHCCRRIDNFLFSPPKTDFEVVPVSDLPWLWIGGISEDGIVTDYTIDVNSCVKYGLNITPEWLDYVLDATNVKWKYLDPKTLEEKDFPSVGFVIDDPIASNPEDSDDE